jgi:UDP-N-acetylglucosamine 2-epimerase (non-hydrolysing)
MKIIIVVGARPNFVKVAPLIEEIKKYPDIKYLLVHTGQHYDAKMSDSFFRDLSIPKADINLGIRAGSHAEQTAGVMIAFEKVCLDQKPDLVLVFGDINSTLACALVSAKLYIKVAHIESGMRSFDRKMPEEINRILTDHISDYLFVTEKAAYDNLIKEGVEKKKIFISGNIMIDALISVLEKLKRSKFNLADKLGLREYCVVTLHRPGNVDDKAKLKEILDGLDKINNKISIVWPLHPRTKKNMEKFKMESRLKKYHIVEPLGYFDFIALVHRAKFILTDSGGIQAEATFLRIPCLTIRETTEHLITISQGTNMLITSRTDIEEALEKIKKRKYKIPKNWNGKSSKRIVDVLQKI